MAEQRRDERRVHLGEVDATQAELRTAAHLQECERRAVDSEPFERPIARERDAEQDRLRRPYLASAQVERPQVGAGTEEVAEEADRLGAVGA